MKPGAELKLKFKQLKRRLKLPHWQIVGVLETLWRVTEANAPAGDIGRLSDEEIAAAFEWEGNAQELLSALTECRWIDPDEEFRLIVHDWSEHCPNHLKGAFAKNSKRFADESARDRARQPAKQPARQDASDVACHPATYPNQSLPNQTVPVQPKNSAGKPRPVYSATFEAWFVSYPRKIGKQDASAAYGRAIDRIALSRALTKTDAHLWLVGVTQQFARSPAGNAGTYTPHPATWLNAGRYDDDPSEWQRENQDERKQQPQRVGNGQRYRG